MSRRLLAVLDSTVLIDFLRGRPVIERVAGLRRSGAIPATTAVNVEEIVRGLRGHEFEAAERLFDGLVVLPIDAEAARRAGVWRREYAERGTTLAQADCLIAGAVANYGGALITGNPKDFPMGELVVEHWPVGQ